MYQRASGGSDKRNVYVIVIVRLVCDVAQTQHEARGREAPEGECCVYYGSVTEAFSSALTDVT